MMAVSARCVHIARCLYSRRALWQGEAGNLKAKQICTRKTQCQIQRSAQASVPFALST